MPEIGAPKGVTKHTELTHREVAGVIDHADGSITPGKLDAIDSPSDDEVAAYNAAQAKFEWKARGAMTVHDRTYHTSPTLPTDDAHLTADPIDHPDGSVTDAKLKSGVGLSDQQICKLPTATEGKVLKRGAAAWEAGDVPAPDPSDTVEDETTWGKSKAAGSSTKYARGDHTHGTPPEPFRLIKAFQVRAGFSVTQGYVVQIDTGQDNVISPTRSGNYANPVGVALESGDEGDWVDVCLMGYCTGKSNEAIQAGYPIGYDTGNGKITQASYGHSHHAFIAIPPATTPASHQPILDGASGSTNLLIGSTLETPVTEAVDTNTITIYVIGRAITSTTGADQDITIMYAPIVF